MKQNKTKIVVSILAIVILSIVLLMMVNSNQFKIYIEQDGELIHTGEIEGGTQTSESAHCCPPIKEIAIGEDYLAKYCICYKLNNITCVEYHCNQYIVRK